MNNIKGFGLKPTPQDNRDFQYHKVFGAVSKLPNTNFIIGDPTIKDQRDSDLCVAYAASSASEYQEETQLSPEYQFAKIKELEGGVESWGSDLRTGAKSVVEFGSLPKEQSPYSLQEDGRNFVADWENWKETYDDDAYNHRKKSFFKIYDIGYKDLFDAFRGALWQNRNSKRAIVTGCVWENGWSYAQDGIIPKGKGREEFGHAFIFIGQEIINGKPYLIAQLSNGKSFGRDGLFYFPREVVNRKMEWEGYMFIDIEGDVARMASWNCLQKMGRLIRKYFLFYFDN